MLRKEIEKIYETLNLKAPLKVQIILLKNKKKLKEEFELISEVKKILKMKEYEEYLLKCNEIILKYGTSNDGASYEINNKEEYEEQKNELDKTFNDVIKEQTKRNKEYLDFMKEDIDIKFDYYSIEDLPEDLSKYNEEEIETLIKFVKE